MGIHPYVVRYTDGVGATNKQVNKIHTRSTRRTTHTVRDNIYIYYMYDIDTLDIHIYIYRYKAETDASHRINLSPTDRYSIDC